MSGLDPRTPLRRITHIANPPDRLDASGGHGSRGCDDRVCQAQPLVPRMRTGSRDVARGLFDGSRRNTSREVPGVKYLA